MDVFHVVFNLSESEKTNGLREYTEYIGKSRGRAAMVIKTGDREVITRCHRTLRLLRDKPTDFMRLEKGTN